MAMKVRKIVLEEEEPERKPLSKAFSQTYGNSFLSIQEREREKFISSLPYRRKRPECDLRLIKYLEEEVGTASLSINNDAEEDKVVFPLRKRKKELGLFQSECKDERLVAWLEYHTTLGGKAKGNKSRNIWWLNPKYKKCKTDVEKANAFEAAVKYFKYKYSDRIDRGKKSYPSSRSDSPEKELMGTAIKCGFGRYRGKTLKSQGKDFISLMEDGKLFLEKHLSERGGDNEYSSAWFKVFPGSYGNDCIPGYTPQQRFENVMKGYYNSLARESRARQEKEGFSTFYQENALASLEETTSDSYFLQGCIAKYKEKNFAISSGCPYDDNSFEEQEWFSGYYYPVYASIVEEYLFEKSSKDNSVDKAASAEDQSPKLDSNSSEKPPVVEQPIDCKPTLHDELFWSNFNRMNSKFSQAVNDNSLSTVHGKDTHQRSRAEVDKLKSSEHWLMPRFRKGARHRERKADHIASVRREQWVNKFKEFYYYYPDVFFYEFFGNNGLGSLYSIPGAYKPECRDWLFEQYLASAASVENIRRREIDPEVLSILDDIRVSPKHREAYRSLIKSVESSPENRSFKEGNHTKERERSRVIPLHDNGGPYIIPARKVNPEVEFLGELYQSIFSDMINEAEYDQPPKPLVFNDGMLYFGKNKRALIHECGKLVVNQDGDKKLFYHPGVEDDMQIGREDMPLWQEAMMYAKRIFSMLKQNNGNVKPIFLVNKVVINGEEYMVPVKLPPEFINKDFVLEPK